MSLKGEKDLDINRHTEGRQPCEDRVRNSSDIALNKGTPWNS